MGKEEIEGRREAVKLAHDSTKQLIVICSATITAFIGITIILKIENSFVATTALTASILFFLSIVFGLLAMFSLAGILEEGEYIKEGRVLINRHYQLFGRLQFLFFALGSFIVVIGIFASVVSGDIIRAA